MSMLAAAEEATEEGQDIFALDAGVVGSNDAIVQSMNYITSNLDIDNLEEDLLNRGRIRMPYTVPSDYENLFECFGLSRRSARPLPDNQTVVPVEQLLLIEDWINMCLDVPSKADDEYLPGNMSCFHELMEQSMPARLDLSSWVAKVMLNIVAEDFPFDSLNDCLCEWQPWMGTDPIRYQRDPDGKFTATIAFIGEAQPGRLVWAPMIREKAPFGLDHGFVREIERTIRSAEAALVALARRVARHVTCCIVYQYAASQAEERGYGILSRKEIGRAVREILGEEWFNLPFDVSLHDWSEDDVLKPNEEMEGMDVFIETRGRDS